MPSTSSYHLFGLALLVLFTSALSQEPEPRLFPFDKVGFVCDDDPRKQNVPCMAGGIYNNEDQDALFRGTYMCRPRSRLFGLVNYNQTVCIPTTFNAVLGERGDTCGCCDKDCPPVCNCPCLEYGDDPNDVEDNHVWVYRTTGILGNRKEAECISRGKASRWTAMWPDEYTCVPDNECPTLAPTGAPSPAPSGSWIGGVVAEDRDYNQSDLLSASEVVP